MTVIITAWLAVIHAFADARISSARLPENTFTRIGNAMPTLAMTVKITAATICWATTFVTTAIVAAPDTASAAFLGLTAADKNANPNALRGVNPSTLFIHFGTVGSLPFRDRKSVVQGKSVSVRVNLGGRPIIKN